MAKAGPDKRRAAGNPDFQAWFTRIVARPFPADSLARVWELLKRLQINSKTRLACITAEGRESASHPPNTTSHNVTS